MMKYYEARPEIKFDGVTDECLRADHQAHLHMVLKAHEKLAYAVYYGTESMKRRAMGWVKYYGAILKQYEDELHRRKLDGYQRS